MADVPGEPGEQRRADVVADVGEAGVEVLGVGGSQVVALDEVADVGLRASTDSMIAPSRALARGDLELVVARPDGDGDRPVGRGHVGDAVDVGEQLAALGDGVRVARPARTTSAVVLTGTSTVERQVVARSCVQSVSIGAVDGVVVTRPRG